MVLKLGNWSKEALKIADSGFKGKESSQESLVDLELLPIG